MEVAIAHTNTALGNGRVIGLWTLCILSGTAFIMAGGAMLAGAPQMFAAKFGVEKWFRIATGLLMVGGAVLLFIPRRIFFAAVLLGATIVSALVAHMTIFNGNPGPVIVSPLLSELTARLTRPNGLSAFGMCISPFQVAIKFATEQSTEGMLG